MNARRCLRRRLALRRQLVQTRASTKNEIHAVLMRRLKGRPPASDLFGRKGRAWLTSLELPLEEQETVDVAALAAGAVYAGYSAGVIVAGPTLEAVRLTSRSRRRWSSRSLRAWASPTYWRSHTQPPWPYGAQRRGLCRVRRRDPDRSAARR